MRAYLALDVGGTEIKSALLDEAGELLGEIRRRPSRADETADVILRNLSGALEEVLAHCRRLGRQAAGAGVAFPGPFDYPQGISRIRGIGKYDALYGLSLQNFLSTLPDMAGIPLLFANDADLFCLGECLLGAGRGYSRVMLVCIGTGLGSGFVADGRLVKTGDAVPADGWLYATPYRDGTVDGWLSATGIRRMIRDAGGFPPGTDVKELAELARRGDRRAGDIFREFGDMLAQVLPPFARRFGAQALVVGGQVSRSADLFIAPLQARLAEEGMALSTAPASDLSAMRAVPLLFTGRATYPY